MRRVMKSEVDFRTLPISELPITDYAHVRREIEKQRKAEKKIRCTNKYRREWQRDYRKKRKEMEE